MARKHFRWMGLNGFSADGMRKKVAYKFFLFFHHIAQTDPLVHSSGSMETVNRDGNLHVAPQQSFSLMPPYNYEKEEFLVERLVTLAYLILAV